MKSKLKLIIAFLIGGIVFSGITIAFASDIFASSIKYKDTTVEGAIDDLYLRVNRDLTFGSMNYERSAGRVYKSGDRTADLLLNSGNYVVNVIYSMALDANDASDTRANPLSVSTCMLNLSCDNDCVISSMGGHYSVGNGESTGAGSKYNRNALLECMYYVKITTDETTLTGAAISWEHSANASNAETILIDGVKVEK